MISPLVAADPDTFCTSSPTHWPLQNSTPFAAAASAKNLVYSRGCTCAVSISPLHIGDDPAWRPSNQGSAALVSNAFSTASLTELASIVALLGPFVSRRAD